MHVLTVPNQKATANYVPAAAVIRRWQALSGIIKARVGGFKSDRKPTAQPWRSLETVKLECRRESGIPCSGEMRRDMDNTSGEGDFLVCN